MAKVTEAGPRSLQCEPLAIIENLNEFYSKKGIIDLGLERMEKMAKESIHEI